MMRTERLGKQRDYDLKSKLMEEPVRSADTASHVETIEALTALATNRDFLTDMRSISHRLLDNPVYAVSYSRAGVHAAVRRGVLQSRDPGDGWSRYGAATRTATLPRLDVADTPFIKTHLGFPSATRQERQANIYLTPGGAAAKASAAYLQQVEERCGELVAS
eukprot:jgi/Tetstr1/440627/TSEL_028937.t1